MYKKIISCVLALTMSVGAVSLPASADTSSAKSKSVTDYTYTVMPILSPFNEYFFVKTDNPDPTSFRFADKSSVYDEDSIISLDWDDWNDEVYLYADINYENEQTGRVNGGYIFKSFDTDGGEIVLQSKEEGYYDWDVTWSDTNVKLKLPALKDDADYLIDTYANGSGFFDNMDAVQSGFSSVCLYSGSNVRGELYKSGSYWGLSTSPHKDQLFYIQSPYTRKDNKQLFASSIYPYRYDSLGFPGMMGMISTRLDSSSSYKWNSNSHYLIDVTYNGETRSYGGQGEGKGQGISEDKIKQYFTFGPDGTNITLENVRQLLDDYSAIEMEDDVPRENALTWESVYDKAGSGAWVRQMLGYSYIYQNGGGTHFSADSAGNNGAEIYWGGDLGYASDAWVDGRYVDSWEKWVKGEKFEDHPTSNILLSNVVIPQITYDVDYRYNYSTGKYEREYSNFQITEKTKTAVFYYSQDDDFWIVSYDAFDDNCARYDQLAEFVEKGLIDEKYLDMVTLTSAEVKALNVDRNTDIVPDDYYIYDGTAEPGTSIKDHKHNYTSEITKQPTCTSEGTETLKCTVCGHTETKAIAKTAHSYTNKVVAPTCTEKGYTLHTCSKCGDSYKDTYVDAKGHKFGSWTVTKPATATAQGVETRKCSVCGKTETRNIPALGGGTISGTAEMSMSVKITRTNDSKVIYSADISKGKFTVPTLEKGTYNVTFFVKNSHYVERTYTVTLNKNVTIDPELHLLGDVNGDGKLSTADAGKVNADVRKTKLLTDSYDKKVADVNGDGKLSTADVGKINAHVRNTKKLW